LARDWREFRVDIKGVDIKGMGIKGTGAGQA
jgi:hypothetical protein